jgi:hypothetical protein
MIAAPLVATALAVSGISLSASPSRLELTGAGTETVQIAPAARSLRLDVTVAGYRLDLRGRPRIAGALDAARWVTVRPHRLVLGRTGATVVVRAAPRARASAGDHEALVLLTASTRSPAGILVRMRVGVLVEVRVPGRLVRRLVVTGLRVQRVGQGRTLLLALLNRGNVTERIRPGGLEVVLRRAGRVIARLRAGPRTVLPHTRAVLELGCRGVRPGLVRAQVGARSFALRL